MTTGSIGGNNRLPKMNKILWSPKGKERGDEIFYFKVIENAGGVPFQLLFGQNIGEGQYLKIGEGIHDLLGIQPEDFTEELFHKMILEVHPVSPGIPSDKSEARNKF